MDIINYIIDFSTNYIYTGGIFFGIFLLFIENIIPVLPYSVFISLNCNAFGLFVGVLISWIGSIIGSYIVYLFYIFLSDKIDKIKFGEKLLKKMHNSICKFKTIGFSELVILYTLPFSPSTVLHILCGLSGMKKKKFIISILLGKFFSILFWAVVGLSIIDNITDIKSIIITIIFLILVYIISKLINKKLNIE